MKKLTLSTLLVLPSLFAADVQPWAAFNPGSYAKLKTTTVTGGNKMVTEMTQTLISKDANNAVVEIETKMMGTSSKTRTNVPLRGTAAAGNPTGPAANVKPTSETITVAGKSIAAQCYDIQSSANGMQTTAHSCVSASVPGSVVKSVSKTSGAVTMEAVTELVEFAAK